ncbi:MAG: hypothetical protein PHO41_11085, partial [Eubacteriales bacterium]|nr:hypothetical protein [Eubacteriales bacterium]
IIPRFANDSKALLMIAKARGAVNFGHAQNFAFPFYCYFILRWYILETVSTAGIYSLRIYRNLISS